MRNLHAVFPCGSQLVTYLLVVIYNKITQTSFHQYIGPTLWERFQVSGLPRSAGAETPSLLYGFTLFPCVQLTAQQPFCNRFIPVRTGARHMETSLPHGKRMWESRGAKLPHTWKRSLSR